MRQTDIRTLVRFYGPMFVFITMTVVGAAIIWAGKLYDMDIGLITTIPIALMLSYFVLNLLPGLRVQSEQAGDNLYYMGFIFTLASLGISLYKFTGEASIEDVVRNFGIAILSTITGIALRIFYNQMRRDPADIESAVRMELAEMTRRVRTELDTLALEFSSYRRTSNQMLSEGFEEIARQAEKNGEAVRATIEAMAVDATKSIQQTSEKLLETLTTTHGHLSELAEKNAATVASLAVRMEQSVSSVVDRAETLSNTMETLIRQYATARSPDDVLRIDVAPAVEALRDLVGSNVKAIETNTTAAHETAKKVISALGPFKQVAAELKGLSADLKASTAANGATAEVFSSALQKMDAAIDSIRLATGEGRRSGERFEKLADQIAAIDGRIVERDEHRALQSDRIEKLLIKVENDALGKEPIIVSAAPNEATPLSANGEQIIQVSPAALPDAGDREETRTDRSRWSLWNR